MNMDEQTSTGVVTKVEKQEKRQERYNIFIDGQYAFSVFEDTLIKYRLFKGQTVETWRLEEIVRADELQRAYRTAIIALSRRLRTEQELADRLIAKGHDAELAGEIVQRLKREGYLDDYEYAVSLTKQRAFSQKKGRLYIRQELMHKGISKELASEALGQIDAQAEFELAYDLAAKRWGRGTDKSREAKRKLAAFLQRRGYPGSVVSQVLRRLPAGENEEMDDEFFD